MFSLAIHNEEQTILCQFIENNTENVLSGDVFLADTQPCCQKSSCNGLQYSQYMMNLVCLILIMDNSLAWEFGGATLKVNGKKRMNE